MNKPEILYEDTDIVAINKPVGAVVHGDGKTERETLVDWFVSQYPDSKEVGEPLVSSDGTVIEKPGIVHRLDKDTSGVMLLAKTQEGFEHLKRQFKNREIEKVYHAFVYNNIKEDRLVIDEPIGRSAKHIKRQAVGKAARGTLREAVTEVTVLGRCVVGGGVHSTYIEARPKTGRMHQIRVHLQSIDRPLVADPIYAANREPILGFERLALHAKAISFTTVAGEQKTVEAPLPKDFEAAVSCII